MIARKSLLPMANVAVGAVLGLVALKTVALYMDIEVYGRVQFALAWMGILYLFADLAMDQAHVKRVSEGMDAADCFATYAVFRLVAAIAFLVVATISIVGWTLVLHHTIEDTTILALVFAALYYVMKGAQSVAQSTFDAQLQTARSQLGSLIETIVRVGLTILFAILFVQAIPYVGHIQAGGALGAWVRSDPAAALAFAYMAGALIAAAAMLIYLRATVRGRGRFRMEILRSYFAFSLPLFLPSMAGLIGLFIDRTMLGVFGTSTQTGGFSGPRQIVTVLEGLAAAVSILLFPAISALVASGGRAQIPSIVDRSVRYLVILTLPIIAFLAAFPVPVLRLTLKGTWEPYAGVLMLLALWSFFLVASRPHLNLLLGHGHTKAAARVGIVQSVIIIALNLVLVPNDIKSLHLTLFGLNALGAAIATLASGIVGYAMLTYYAWKLEGYRQRVAIWKHFVAAIAMVAATYPIAQAWPAFLAGHAIAVIALAALGVVVFTLALVLLRDLTREDLAFARSTLDPGAMARYLRSELFRREE